MLGFILLTGQPVEDEPDEHGGGIVQLTNLRLANCKTERL